MNQRSRFSLFSSRLDEFYRYIQNLAEFLESCPFLFFMTEPEHKPEPEPESKDDGKISGKWTSEPSGKERTRPTKRDEAPPTESAVSEEQKNIIKKLTNKLFWLRICFALIGGAIATFLFEGIEDSEEHRWLSITFMIVLFLVTCFIAKGMKINFPKSDRKKLVTTGIGSFIFLY